MITPILSPVRRIEAKRLLAYMFSRKEFDAELFVEQLAAVMIDTPEIVRTTAAHLRAWNNSRGENDPRFTMHDTDGEYEQIAEVVLDAAAIYRGETTEVIELVEGETEVEEEVLSYVEVTETLTRVRDYLFGVASGRAYPAGYAMAFSAQLARVERTLQAGRKEAGT